MWESSVFSPHVLTLGKHREVMWVGSGIDSIDITRVKT